MRPNSRTDFTVAIICALTLEAEAIEETFDEVFDRLSKVYGKHPKDRNAYINGRIGAHNVVLAYLPDKAKRTAASVATSLPFSYPNIGIGLVVGICGGAPRSPSNEQIFLGDVVMSDAVVEYDSGVQLPGGFQRATDINLVPGRPSREIRNLLAGLRAIGGRREFQDQISQHLHKIQQRNEKWRRPCFTDDIVFNASYHHKHHKLISAKCPHVSGNGGHGICEGAMSKICADLGCDDNEISRRRHHTELDSMSIHIGAIASADTEMRSGEHRDRLVSSERVIGFETIGAGVWDIFPCIIIKGVCDYADSHKNNTWQAYAAATGSCAAKSFLEYWRPVATGP
ncbi:nucleoside phosphorylase domain-containing protein [Aspergillus candidus]|uniref:Nucleoside phosphorylase domain-containing protein n=1 Tax=Aspergillus candidus TaxID=41067 RepID=A0A2I2F8J4_ASPCN|nr:nucleoside phosphorylase domain-containing protein [Aspergillus candidus]PLB36939.1 nucleoside phosphorylase domain-containing protein [Aspergillus candidus]